MTTMNHTRSFGTELEITGLTVREAAQALRDAGIIAYDSSSNTLGTEEFFEGPAAESEIRGCGCDACYHSARREALGGQGCPSRAEIAAVWRVVEDGSVSDGCEVVSPILSGDQGIASLRRIVAILKAAGASVNNTCGFHVHVNANDLHAAEMVNAVKRYARFESQIDSFMAPRRRGDNARWCRSMAGFAEQLDNDSVKLSGKAVAETQENGIGRYLKLNTAAFLRHGTIEFRQHAGTLNIDKMVNWIVFCVNFVENSRLSEDFLRSYEQVSQKQMLLDIAKRLIASNRGVHESTIASNWNVPEASVEGVMVDLLAAYPQFEAYHIDNNGWIKPSKRNVEIPQDAIIPPAMPDGPDMFDNVPERAVTYLRRRAEGYRHPLAALGGRIRASVNGIGF